MAGGERIPERRGGEGQPLAGGRPGPRGLRAFELHAGPGQLLQQLPRLSGPEGPSAPWRTAIRPHRPLWASGSMGVKEEGEAVRFIDREAFAALLAELEARRYELIGPTVRDGTIVLDAIEGPGDLPRGVAEIQGAGTYRREARGDDRLFGFAHGPHSAKQYLFPSSEVVAEAERVDGRLRVEEPVREQPKYAFIGLRS